ncbi:hypothetical protein AB0K15_40685 [Amycolatopsis sp. NPDC049253]
MPVDKGEDYPEERQARVTAQSILAKHRRLDPDDQKFRNVDTIDVAGAD